MTPSQKAKELGCKSLLQAITKGEGVRLQKPTPGSRENRAKRTDSY
jgi:hypothetical protein